MPETMFSADALKPEKIKTPFACIVVVQTHKGLYHDILWYDPKTKLSYIGYGSYSIDLVLDDLQKFFEVDKKGLWKNEIVPIPDCGDCKYRGKKPAKCSCCRRNLYIKDCYESGGQAPQREDEQ